MRDSYDCLLTSQSSDGVVTVVINRPHVANAINTQTGRDLLDVFESLQRVKGNARCVILTGSGDRHFCAGGDLKERRGMTDAEFFAQHEIYERMTLAVVECPIPVLAAVNGAAFGGGC